MSTTSRPSSLVCAVVALVLAALLFGMTATATSTSTSGSGLAVIALVVALFAATHHWARITVTVLLGLQFLFWFPVPIQAFTGDRELTDNPVLYVIVAVPLTVVGVVLLFGPASNAYFAARRAGRTG